MNSPANTNKHPESDTTLKELWDLYNRDGEPQGRTIVGGDQLNDGDYHLVVQIWVKNARGEYLIQKRADHVKQAPGV
jgi:isopentenyldiphosphate isomerase